VLTNNAFVRNIINDFKTAVFTAHQGTNGEELGDYQRLRRTSQTGAYA